MTVGRTASAPTGGSGDGGTAGTGGGERTERGAPGFGAALRSEWAKFLALPSNRAIIAATVFLTVGITALTGLFGDTGAIAREQADGRYSVIFFGASFGVWTFSALAANVVAAEYRTGAIAWTLTATPRRARVLGAKFLVVGAAAPASGLVIALANFWVTQTVLARAGEDVLTLAEPGMLRAVLVYIPVGMAVQSLLTAAAAAVLRSGPAAFVSVLLLGLLPIAVAPVLGGWWGENIPRYMTGAATESLAGIAVPGTPGFLPTLPAALVVLGWTALFLAVATAVFERRDA
ncbi:ABC transporter permease subunit [Nocardiopsis suaedae]|uniref:ABC transporter permease subunit n=1 Tax=Nocardiopsis suaedae TaxID=3018444 RepID=A0ABT4TNH6_9ACTN|nr:ABC transporter permease subunit [Nocardiopsis suaedae]MDA2806252.1 ABC transporter permease subunit [Nocardiopsis suaedae]